MMRKILVGLFLLLLLSPASAQQKLDLGRSGGACPLNGICSDTPPNGVNDRRVATTAWVLANAGGGGSLALAQNFMFIGNASNLATAAAATGDLSLLFSAGNAQFTIGNNVVSDAKLRQGGGLSIIGRSASTTGNVADIVGTAGTGLVVNSAGTSVLFTRTPVYGAVGAGTGAVSLSGTTSGSVTIQPQAAAGTYNFNLPTAAGTAGQALLSGGGGAAAQTYGTLGVAAGGTNCAAASGTCLDNITGFSGTGLMRRTGAGTYTFGTTVSTAELAANSVDNTILRQGAAFTVIGRSANSTGNVADIAGATDQVLRVNAAGTALGFGQINLASSSNAVSGTLGVGNGGTGLTGAAWTTYTPTITSSVGTITTATGSGAFQQIGKTVFIRIRASITTNGTGSGTVIATLPGGMTAIAAQSQQLGAWEAAVAGKMVSGLINLSGTDVRFRFFDNTYPGANGAIIDANGVFEVQ